MGIRLVTKEVWRLSRFVVIDNRRRDPLARIVDVVPSLCSMMGTGGGNTPLVMVENDISENDRPADGEQPPGQLHRAGRL